MDPDLQPHRSFKATGAHGGPTGEFDPRGRFLNGSAPGDGQGSDPFNSPTQALHSGGAQIGNSSNITLNGTPGRNGHLLVSVWNESLIARVGPDRGDAALQEPHVRAFDVTGRPMRNWVLVEPEGVEGDDQLAAWVGRAITFVRTLPGKR